MKIFVTGGAGYIGSHTARLLKEKKYEVLVFDSLEQGHKESLFGVPCVVGLLSDSKKLDEAISSFKPDAVIHFAGYISMGESVENPSKYFRNNVGSAICLFDAMVKHGIKKLVFSSSAGVYGNPLRIPIFEDDPKNPTNPYGETKLMVERILHWYDVSYHFSSMSIRYFNAAGASLDAAIGEDHNPETHIIPIAIQVALGVREKFLLYGDDYATPDGTCIRDYIHVLDLANVHILALEALINGAKTNAYNAGTGIGYSNKQVVEEVKKVSGVDFRVEITQRRPGDANELVAGVDKIKKELHFKPQFSDLNTIVKTAWQWHKNRPKGFSA